MRKTIYKKFTATFFLLSFALFVFAQQNIHSTRMAEKVLTKSFNLQGNQTVSLELGSTVEVQTWSKNIVRIQMTISLENSTNSTLKSLVQAGKYHLKSSATDGVYTIYGKDMWKQIEVGGNPLKENLSFVVYVPQNIKVKNAKETEASL